MPNDVEAFYEHLAGCEQCAVMPCAVCDLGHDLLLDAAEDLPEHWQDLARKIYRKEQLEREAEANARFYGNMEEF